MIDNNIIYFDEIINKIESEYNKKVYINLKGNLDGVVKMFTFETNHPCKDEITTMLLEREGDDFIEVIYIEAKKNE